MKNLIGLMTGRNPNLLVGMLGILKAGCGFVPIDPTYPLERINFIVSDCGLEVLLTENRYLDQAWRVSESQPALKHVVCLDDVSMKKADNANVRHHEPKDWLPRPSTNQDLGVEPDPVLYALYTSRP